MTAYLVWSHFQYKKTMGLLLFMTCQSWKALVGLGDCWLMAALACLAEYPAKLKGLFESKHITEVMGAGRRNRFSQRWSMKIECGISGFNEFTSEGNFLHIEIEDMFNHTEKMIPMEQLELIKSGLYHAPFSHLSMFDTPGWQVSNLPLRCGEDGMDSCVLIWLLTGGPCRFCGEVWKIEKTLNQTLRPWP